MKRVAGCELRVTSLTVLVCNDVFNLKYKTSPHHNIKNITTSPHHKHHNIATSQTSQYRHITNITISPHHKMNYKPIDCNFYDILEANAVLKKVVTIEFMDDSGILQTTTQRIVDLFIKNKIEFMKLENGLEIRLDYLKSVDGKVLEGFCGI